MSLVISNLSVHREGMPIIKDVSFTVAPGELIVLVGKNGAGKTTLLQSLMGHPHYNAVAGSIAADGEEVAHMPTHERARRGLFLALQQPPAITGVPLADLVRSATAGLRGEQPKTASFAQEMQQALAALRLDPRFAERAVNEGLSGGERKRSELVQMLMLRPKYALLDEPDSGLDAEAMRFAAEAIAAARAAGTGVVLVSHYEGFLQYFSDFTLHVLRDGHLIRSGDAHLLAHGLAALLTD